MVQNAPKISPGEPQLLEGTSCGAAAPQSPANRTGNRRSRRPKRSNRQQTEKRSQSLSKAKSKRTRLHKIKKSSPRPFNPRARTPGLP